jgi:hypothetical protein
MAAIYRLVPLPGGHPQDVWLGLSSLNQYGLCSSHLPCIRACSIADQGERKRTRDADARKPMCHFSPRQYRTKSQESSRVYCGLPGHHCSFLWIVFLKIKGRAQNTETSCVVRQGKKRVDPSWSLYLALRALDGGNYRKNRSLRVVLHLSPATQGLR